VTAPEELGVGARAEPEVVRDDGLVEDVVGTCSGWLSRLEMVL
jgi:hypothetical protein